MRRTNIESPTARLIGVFLPLTLLPSPTMNINDLREPLAVHGSDLTASKFANVNLANTVYDDVNLKQSTFSNIDFSSCTFQNVNMTNVSITNANMIGMKVNDVLVYDLLQAYRERTEKDHSS